MNLFHWKKQTLVGLGLSFESLRWVPSALIVAKIQTRLAPNPHRIAVTDACRAQHL